MHYSARHRIARYLLTVLVVASPVLADGGEGKLAPVVDLNPRYNEAASSTLRGCDFIGWDRLPACQKYGENDRLEAYPTISSQPLHEPDTLILEAEAIPLATASVSTVPSQVAPVRRSLRPVVSFAAPFDPATVTPRQQKAALANRQASSIKLAPVVRVYEPIRPASDAMNQLPQLAATPRPVLEPVHRTVFLATRTDRLQRTNVPTTQPVGTHNPLATRIVTTLDSFTRPKSTPTTALPHTESTERAANPNTQRVSDLIQIAQTNPVAIKNEVVSPAQPSVRREEVIDVAKVLTKRSSPIVELASNPIVAQSPTITLTAQQPSEVMEPQPLIKSVPEMLLECSTPAETSTQEIPPTTAARPVIQLAEVTPLLTTLQSSPSASDLPAPASQPPLTEEQIQQLEVIEAFELPTNFAAARFAREGAVAHRMGTSRSHAETVMTWEAPAVCHRPLYFEDINLERHGYKVPLIQPAISAAHFFGRVPLLPYMMVTEGHRNCQYTLGHYRPGDYAPYSLYVPRLRLDASAAEMALAAGLIFAFP
jgi:hypothetical protein